MFDQLAGLFVHNLQLQKSPSRIFGQNSGNSVDISKVFFEIVIWKFESSQVSQAVRRSEWPSLIRAPRPANGGLLPFGVLSLCSRFRRTRHESGESLWLVPPKFPFSGDQGWRMSSITTGWGGR
jgi:hypothetical protein